MALRRLLNSFDKQTHSGRSNPSAMATKKLAFLVEGQGD
jgi:hypothetical protein